MTHDIPDFLRVLAACWTKSTIQRTGKGQYSSYDISFGSLIMMVAAYNKLLLVEFMRLDDLKIKQLLSEYLDLLIAKDFKES
jgi:hypothetical protein